MRLYHLPLLLLPLSSLLTPAASAAPYAGHRTTPLDSALWAKSEWISVADAPVITGRVEGRNERAADGASWFTASIRNDKRVKSAVWMTAGLGVYSLFINGQPIGEEVLRPGFTHQFKTKLSFTYDVTDAIKRKSGAENLFAVQVTPGWWADKIVTPGGQDGMSGTKTAFRGVLEVTYTDGSKSYFPTDDVHWKSAIGGPVTHAAIFDGEEYDARVAPMHTVAYSDAVWQTPEINREFRGGLFPSVGAEVYRREDLALLPVEAYVWQGVSGATESAHGKVNVIRKYQPGKEMVVKPGETLVIDFGQNCAGVPDFLFAADEGTTLECLTSEILNDGNGAHSRGMDGPEGSVHRLSLRVPDDGMRMRYTFGPSAKRGYVTYSPLHTFFGYRFISLTADGEVRLKEVKSVPVTSIAQRLERGTITTGDASINKLISNTMWGMRSNYLSVPTDCPQRNERLGWTADTQVFTETGTYFADTRDFFHKWMRDMRDSQAPSGGFPGVAPFAQYGNEMTRLGWSDAGIIVPYVIWKQYADKEIVEENWEAMEKYMNLLNDTRYDHFALRGDNGDYQWADWLSYEPLESCSGRKDYCDENGQWHVRPEAYDYWNYLSACYWLSNSEMMRDMALSTGRDHVKYECQAREARSYILDTFFTPEGEFKTDILNTMQTPALFALRNRLLTGEAKDRMVARLRQNFADHENCLQTGFLGTSILMPTLTENGMSDIAYELLFQRKNPSWLYSIDNGATTIWERWNSYMLDAGMGPQGMNSFNHYAYGCVCEWMWETMAGISADPSDPGFRKIVMRPVPDKRLGFVKAEYDSPQGKIKSHWRYEGEKCIWKFTIPKGAEAEVTLPGSTETRTYPAGTYTLTI